jgi:hypothetical protein
VGASTSAKSIQRPLTRRERVALETLAAHPDRWEAGVNSGVGPVTLRKLVDAGLVAAKYDSWHIHRRVEKWPAGYDVRITDAGLAALAEDKEQ